MFPVTICICWPISNPLTWIIVLSAGSNFLFDRAIWKLFFSSFSQILTTTIFLLLICHLITDIYDWTSSLFYSKGIQESQVLFKGLSKYHQPERTTQLCSCKLLYIFYSRFFYTYTLKNEVYVHIFPNSICRWYSIQDFQLFLSSNTS